MEPSLDHLRDPQPPLAIIGLGYVGLPLAVELGRHRPVVGFDINPARIAELQGGRDSTREVTPDDLRQAQHLSYTSDPERINPGDPTHRLSTIKKVTSGSTPEVAAAVDALYRQIITAGTHPASSIRVAEDLVKRMLRRGIGVCHSRILVLGFTFKENCPDLRNTRVIDIIHALRDYNIAVDCFDPWIDPADALREYGLRCLPELPAPGTYDAVILAVAHRAFIEMGAATLRRLGEAQSILYDVKSALPADAVDARL